MFLKKNSNFRFTIGFSRIISGDSSAKISKIRRGTMAFNGITHGITNFPQWNIKNSRNNLKITINSRKINFPRIFSQ
jgi:adenine C2-methylase RlmN of 23S rRNA A2503 and tRNA A37